MHHDQRAHHTGGMVIRWPGVYDLVMKTFFLGREQRVRRKVIAAAGLRPGELVLDVGCGTGTLALLAAEAVGPRGRVYGVDPAPEMVHRAREKAARAGAEVRFEVGLIEALDFPDQSVDVVISMLVFHHLPSDELQRAALSEVRRVLTPGGRLVLVDFGGTKQIERLVAEAESARFGAVTTDLVGPSVLFSLVAKTTPSAPA